MTDEFICFHYQCGSGLYFGRVAFERKDVILADVFMLGNYMVTDKSHPAIVRTRDVIGRGTKHAMQDAANAGNRLLRPYPSMETVIAAAKAEMNRAAEPQGE